MNDQAPHNRPYTRTDIEQYLQGRLSPAQMHAMEKAALQDPLLADAIEGYRGSDLSTAQVHLQDIQQQLLQQKDKQVIIVKGHFAAKRWWRAAAVVIVLAGIGGTGWYFMHNAANKEEIAIAPVASKPVPATPVTVDTIAAQPAPPAPVLVQATPTDKKRLPAHNPNTTAQQPVTSIDTLETAALATAKAEALADLQSQKEMKRTLVPQANELAKAKAATNGLQQPLMLRGQISKGIDSSKSNLSEVVVVGLGHQQKKNLTATIQHPTAPADSLNLSPDGGWNHFNEYLSNKLGADTHGELVSDLVLDETGKIKDIIIIRAFDRSLDPFSRAMSRKIKQALLDGPVWLVGNIKKPGTFRLNLEF